MYGGEQYFLQKEDSRKNLWDSIYLKECVFKPKINRSPKEKNDGGGGDNINVYERLNEARKEPEPFKNYNLTFKPKLSYNFKSKK